jgi:N-acetylglutamate synthase-like GNAT family acetyltransferase
MTPENILFRSASQDDLREAHALIESAYRGDTAKAGWTHEADLLDDQRTDIDTLSSIIHNPDEMLLIALAGGTIIGCVQLTRISPTVTYLGLLAVNPRRQANGLGKQIIAAAEQTARQQFGSNMLQLSVISVRSELIAYYERRGFVLTGEIRPFPVACDPPLKLAVMEKPLLA